MELAGWIVAGVLAFLLLVACVMWWRAENKLADFMLDIFKYGGKR